MDILYKMSGVSINGENLNCSNIHTFKLNKRYESRVADIYTTGKRLKTKYGQFIIHIKDAKAYSKNNLYLEKSINYERVDWFEHSRCCDESLDSDIKYIEERL